MRSLLSFSAADFLYRPPHTHPQLLLQQPGHASLGGPVVVVFASRHPEALEPSLLGLLQLRLLLDLPAAESREELLLAWLMEREAAVGVNDVEQLAR
jgi:hypothetical protein